MVYSDCSLTTALINELIGGSCNTFPAWKLVLLQNNRVKALHSPGIQLYCNTRVLEYQIDTDPTGRVAAAAGEQQGDLCSYGHGWWWWWCCCCPSVSAGWVSKAQCLANGEGARLMASGYQLANPVHT